MRQNRKRHESQLVPAAPAAPAAAEALPPVPAELLAFDPVLLRYRQDGFTPERQRAFIEALAETLSPALAAARVGVTVQSAYRLRRRAGAEGFAAAWMAAMRRGLSHRLRDTAVDLAVNGRLVRRYYHGKLLYEERVHSERLLLKLIDKADKLFADAPAESLREAGPAPSPRRRPGPQRVKSAGAYGGRTAHAGGASPRSTSPPACGRGLRGGGKGHARPKGHSQAPRPSFTPTPSPSRKREGGR